MTLEDKDWEILVNPGKDYYNEYVKQAWEEVHWMFSLEDWETWAEALGEDLIHLVAVDKVTKEQLGCVTGTYFRNKEGKRVIFSIGSYYMFPKHRGKKIGSPLFKELVREAKSQGITCALNGVINMSEKYASAEGFSFWRSGCQLEVYTPEWKDVKVVEKNVDGVRVVSTKDFKDFESLAAFDDELGSGYVDRMKFLKIWLGRKSAYGRVALDEHNKVLGVINIRECYDDNLNIGPFYATTYETAELLLSSVLSEIKGNGKHYNILNFNCFTSNPEGRKLVNEVTEGKSAYGSNMILQFTNEVFPVKDEFVYSMTEYAQSYV
uniref:N-acetyltransferase domain-containing protein n=1 Tax=Rhabditophanes sp. KR3021 TaxID=114890 RepID=A0AC35U9D5_9BILA